MGAVGKIISSIRELSGKVSSLFCFFSFWKEGMHRQPCFENSVRGKGCLSWCQLNNQLSSRRRVDYKFVYARQSFFVPEIKLTMYLKRRDRTVWQQRSTPTSPIFFVLSTRMSAACTFP